MTELICIICPKGCHLRVDEENGYSITGNACTRGEEYGRTELMNPTRVLTSIVKAEGGTHSCCSVKTNGGIPKKCIFEAMDLLKDITLKSPVKIGDIIVNDVCGSGIDWIATKNI